MTAALDAIETKKTGGALSRDLIETVITGYVAGDVPDYQVSALLMAIRLVGMDPEETAALTTVMADSGPRYSYPGCVDKHSTGGVGDKITLGALPLVAACGVPVAKLSGRGLGTTGGTLDKMESIPGLRVALGRERFAAQVASVGLVVGEAGELAPADLALYALRDVTGTVDSLPLIASSIVSKKLATGAGHVLYDVKAGAGALMTTVESATGLAHALVDLSRDLGLAASAVVTAMDAPLGRAVGNAVEVAEAAAFLRGEASPQDLVGECLDVATRLVALHGSVADPATAVSAALASGAGYASLAAMVTAQDGDASALEAMPLSPISGEVLAGSSGWVGALDALGVARAALSLGAGRATKTDVIDHGAGVELAVGVGDRVETGQVVALLRGTRGVEAARTAMTGAHRVVGEPVDPRPTFLAEV